MKTRAKANFLLLCAVLLTVVISFSPFLLGKFNAKRINYPQLKNGQADFSDTKIVPSSSIYLTGEWFCYNGHLFSENINLDHTIEKIPASISSFSKTADNSGCRRTYCAVLNNLDFKNATIYIPNFAGTYSIFVNGELVAQSGNVINSQPNSTLELISFPHNFEKNIEYIVAIEVSCEMMPGLYMTPVIADFDHAQSYNNIAETLRAILFGIVLFLGFFILIYSLKNSNLFASKWLPVLTFAVAFRLMISTEGYSTFRFLFPSVNYENMTLLICMSTFIIKLLALLFYSETLDVKFNKGIFYTMGAVSLLCTAITSFFPFIFFNPYYYIIIQAVTLPFDIILLSYLTESVARKVPYAKLYTIGYIALISGIMVDCFYTNGLIPYISSLFMPITFFLFIITFISIFFDKITAIYRASVKAAELDKELVTANTAIMISQIQPHFLYNALNTIKYLIKRDPKTAEKAVISFSKYLRGNMDSITQKSPIPFAEELEHIKNYCDIELLRFEEKLEIVYNTDFVDFKVPSLTIQPLVENAIKHGVTKRPEGGTVTITTEETDNFYTVVIEDNGIGFDAENPDYTPNDNHAHVGLKNVKNRLEMMVNAEVVVQSELDVGTTITINIPKGEKL